jgi:hypothetical protein
MEESVTVPVQTTTLDYTGPCLAVSLALFGLVVVALVIILLRGRQRHKNE